MGGSAGAQGDPRPSVHTQQSRAQPLRGDPRPRGRQIPGRRCKLGLPGLPGKEGFSCKPASHP